MKAVYAGSKTYQLINDRDHAIGSLIYQNFYSYRSVITTDAIGSIDMIPRPWGSNIRIVQDNCDLGEAKMKWWSTSLDLKFKDRGGIFTLKKTGFWKSRFVLIDQEKVQVLDLTPVFRWKTMRHDFEILTKHGARYAPEPHTILIAVYCANYMLALASAAT
ncbi:MAG: hypothetical protein ACOYXT_25020 [Bacteroidota bacterium]